MRAIPSAICEHGADLGELGLAGLQALDPLPQDVADLVWT